MLIRLLKENRGEVEPVDLSDHLIAKLGDAKSVPPARSQTDPAFLSFGSRKRTPFSSRNSMPAFRRTPSISESESWFPA